MKRFACVAFVVVAALLAGAQAARASGIAAGVAKELATQGVKAGHRALRPRPRGADRPERGEHQGDPRPARGTRREAHAAPDPPGPPRVAAALRDPRRHAARDREPGEDEPRGARGRLHPPRLLSRESRLDRLYENLGQLATDQHQLHTTIVDGALLSCGRSLQDAMYPFFTSLLAPQVRDWYATYHAAAVALLTVRLNLYTYQAPTGTTKQVTTTDTSGAPVTLNVPVRARVYSDAEAQTLAATVPSRRLARPGGEADQAGVPEHRVGLRPGEDRLQDAGRAERAPGRRELPAVQGGLVGEHPRRPRLRAPEADLRRPRRRPGPPGPGRAARAGDPLHELAVRLLRGRPRHHLRVRLRRVPLRERVARPGLRRPEHRHDHGPSARGLPRSRAVVVQVGDRGPG